MIVYVMHLDSIKAVVAMGTPRLARPRRVHYPLHGPPRWKSSRREGPTYGQYLNIVTTTWIQIYARVVFEPLSTVLV